jgi:hypothetical protein
LNERAERVKGRRTSWLAPLLAAAFMFGIWAASPLLFGCAEPWDSPYPVYSGASLLGGVILGFLFPHHLYSYFLGAWAGQVVALLFLPGHDRGWFALGLVTTGVGSVFLVLAAAAGRWLRVRSTAQQGRCR